MAVRDSVLRTPGTLASSRCRPTCASEMSGREQRRKTVTDMAFAGAPRRNCGKRTRRQVARRHRGLRPGGVFDDGLTRPRTPGPELYFGPGDRVTPHPLQSR